MGTISNFTVLIAKKLKRVWQLLTTLKAPPTQPQRLLAKDVGEDIMAGMNRMKRSGNFENNPISDEGFKMEDVEEVEISWTSPIKEGFSIMPKIRSVILVSTEALVV